MYRDGFRNLFIPKYNISHSSCVYHTMVSRCDISHSSYRLSMSACRNPTFPNKINYIECKNYSNVILLNPCEIWF